MPSVRRFPPPCTAEETACFVRDANGQALARVYFEDEPGRARRPSCFIRDTNGQALAYAYFEDEPGRRAAAHLPTSG